MWIYIIIPIVSVKLFMRFWERAEGGEGKEIEVYLEMEILKGRWLRGGVFRKGGFSDPIIKLFWAQYIYV